jgi:pimeloyl-ACP methyl ester carboxylesterase
MSAIVLALLVLAASGAGYQLIGRVRDVARLPPPGRLVDVGNGRRLHLHCMGAGQPDVKPDTVARADVEPAVIFDAGIAASSLSWSRVQPAVAAFAQACSYDRPGLAWSDAIPGPLTAARLAHLLHALVAAAAIPPPFVLVAHSFGTFVVRAFAHAYPTDVAGLVLVDPIYPSEWIDMTAAGRRRLRGGACLSRVGAALAAVGFVRLCLTLLVAGSTAVPGRVSRTFGSEAATTLRRLVGEVQKLPPELWPAVAAHWSRPKCFVAMARHLSGLPRSAREIAATGSLGAMPLVVITAASQPPAVREEHARIARLSSRGRHVIAGAGGHWIHLDQPDVVVRAIRDVIEMARHGAPDGSESATQDSGSVTRD